MKKSPGAALHSSWNWELISDKPLDWWVPRIARIKQAHQSLCAAVFVGATRYRVPWDFLTVLLATTALVRGARVGPGTAWRPRAGADHVSE
jgi:hypothetical protein